MTRLMSESEVWQCQSWRCYRETTTPWTWTVTDGVTGTGTTGSRMNRRDGGAAVEGDDY